MWVVEEKVKRWFWNLPQTSRLISDAEILRLLEEDDIEWSDSDIRREGVGMEWSTATGDEYTPPTADRRLSRDMMGLRKTFDFFFRTFDNRTSWCSLMYTNIKIGNLCEKCKFPNSSWLHDITMKEMQAFAGLLIYLGTRQDNHISTSELWSILGGYSMYQAVMPQQRFQFILWALRLVLFSIHNGYPISRSLPRSLTHTHTHVLNLPTYLFFLLLHIFSLPLVVLLMFLYADVFIISIGWKKKKKKLVNK